jgi:hypothetical protein
MGEWIHIIFTSALVEVEWSASRPGRFTRGKEPPVPVVKEVGNPRAGLDDMEK